MTQQVRMGYRNHRKATWGLALAVVALIAAVVIPLASGAAPKYYILTTSPSAICFTGAGQTQQFTLTVKNDSRNNTLGSAEITAPNFITLTPNTLGGEVTLGSSNDEHVIKLRNLGLLTQGDDVAVTVLATINSADTGNWTSVAKQSNNFADAPGPGNLFTLRGSPPSQTSLTATTCSYVFVQKPVDAERGSAQTVNVQLWTGGSPVSVSGPLPLTALQDGSAVDNSGNQYFDGLTASGPDATGTFADKQWTFSVTGKISGSGYALKAGNTISDPTFRIADGLCQPNTTDTQHLTSSCSVTSDLGGGFESGVTINNHSLPSSIAIDFEAGSLAEGNCGENWHQAKYSVNGTDYVFPGVELDFDWGLSGMLKVIYRVRNADWVLTDVSRGNSDIEICAGARHSDIPAGGDGSVNNSGYGAFLDKNGLPAQWDSGDQLYWGVLASVQNPAKVKKDPVVCGRGTQDLPTGPGDPPATETWRTWTICIPFDWDWKNFG